jgi:peroxiredoxin
MKYFAKTLCLLLLFASVKTSMAQSEQLFMKIWKAKDEVSRGADTDLKVEQFTNDKMVLLGQIKDLVSQYFNELNKGNEDADLKKQILALYAQKHDLIAKVKADAIEKADEALVLELVEHMRPKDLKAFMASLKPDNKRLALYKEWLQGFHLTAEGTALKHFSLKDRDGKPLNTADLKGKIFWIDSWASKCAPCIRKLKQMQPIYEKYHKKGFEIVAVSWDYTLRGYMKTIEAAKTDWLKVMDKHQFKWLNVFDEKDAIMGGQFGSVGKNLLVDENGIIIGFDLHPLEIEQILESKLK